MPRRDDEVYGLSASDVEEVLTLLGGKDSVFHEGQVRQPRSIICKAPTGGIPAISSNLVTFVECDVHYRATNTITLGTTKLRVCNMSSQAVTANAYILAVPTNIGYVAIEFC